MIYMPKALAALSLATCMCALAQSSIAVSLMPLPVTVAAGTGALTIDSSFTASSTLPDPRLRRALERMVSRISRQTGILMPAAIGAGKPTTLTVECHEAGPSYPSLKDDESYRLDITPESARLTARTVAGALAGLATFVQLVVPGPAGFQAPAVHVEDKPRFSWRGLMLDASRHWMPIPVVERNLDAMAAVKLNVFHWHLSDDQGFRVESKRFPKLQQMGSDGKFYTQEEIRHIVAYARDRGIRVIPEFDVPGHTTSWLVGYPNLGLSPGPYEIGRRWGVYDTTMDPTKEETFRFLDTFFGEMAPLFPDPYFHIGGDEVRETAWKDVASIQAFARQHNLKGSHELQANFNRRLHAILKKYGKTMVGWDEILQPDLGSDIVIQSWRGQKSLSDAARQGYRGLLSFGYYLDHLRPAGYHYGIDPMDDAARDLTLEQAARILGGEACMWAEYVNDETVDSRIWPRAAVIAERFWSPREVTDVDSMYRRMEAVSRQLDFVGVEHRTHYAAMLDRLSGGKASPALRVFADAVEGVGLGDRQRGHKYTSLMPLNRLPDAARPESEFVRTVEQAAARLAANPASAPDQACVRNAFTEWRDNDQLFAYLARDNALLMELVPVSKALAATAAIGWRHSDTCSPARLHRRAGWHARNRRSTGSRNPWWKYAWRPCGRYSSSWKP
jgi:hexosaminidase